MEALPVNWASCRLGDFLIFEYGKSLTKAVRRGNGQYRVFGSSGVVGLHDAYLVEGPVIIVGRKGAAGSVSYSEINCWPIDTTYYIRNSQFFSLKFAYYLLRCLNLAKLETSTAIPGLNRDMAYDENALLPPLPEQHRIVAKIEELFSELDHGVASLKTAREQIKVYRQSLLKNAFEGKLTAAWRAAHRDQLETATALQQRIARERQARYQQQLADWQTQGGPKPKTPKPLPPLTAEELADLPELPEGWGWVRLGELASVIAGYAFEKAEYSESGVKLFQIANVVFGGVDWEKTVFLPAGYWDDYEELRLFSGDVVMALNRPLLGDDLKIGKLGVADTPALLYQRVGKFVPHDMHVTDLIYWFLRSPLFIKRLKSELRGVNIPFINQTRLMEYPVPLFCFSELFQLVSELEQLLSEADQLDKTLATALQQADALRQSILKKAFCGQLVQQDKNEEPATALLERILAERLSGPAKKKTRSTAGATR